MRKRAFGQLSGSITCGQRCICAYYSASSNTHLSHKIKTFWQVKEYKREKMDEEKKHLAD